MLFANKATVFGPGNLAYANVGAMFLQPFHQGRTECMVYVRCYTDKTGHPDWKVEGAPGVSLGAFPPITIELACDDPDYYKQLHEKTKAALLAFPGNEGMKLSMKEPGKSIISKILGK